MVKWQSRDLETGQRPILRSDDKQSWRHEKDNTVDPKSWLEWAITDERSGRNTDELKDQVKQCLGPLEMMWLVYMDGYIV